MNSIANNKHEVNPCLGCDCYDLDFGWCTIIFEGFCPFVSDEEGDEKNDKT